jgi:hypothetical protein
MRQLQCSERKENIRLNKSKAEVNGKEGGTVQKLEYSFLQSLDRLRLHKRNSLVAVGLSNKFEIV